MRIALAALAGVLSMVPAIAQTPTRDLLAAAAFADTSKAAALGKVQSVIAATARDSSLDGRVVYATAIGYRAKLTTSRGDLSQARKLFEGIVASHPRAAEGQLGIGAWHLATLRKAGGLLGKVLGANRATGHAALERAVATGGNRALYAGMAGLLRVDADPKDARGRQLIEMAAGAPTPTNPDRIIQRAAVRVLVPLRAGDRDGARRLAKRLLPFGAFD